MKIIVALAAIVMACAMLVLASLGCYDKIANSLNNASQDSTKEHRQVDYRGIVFSPEFKTDSQEFIEAFELFVTEALVPTGINLIVLICIGVTIILPVFLSCLPWKRKYQEGSVKRMPPEFLIYVEETVFT